MNRRPGRPLSATALLVWSAFFLHSCISVRQGVLDPVALEQIVSPPRVQVGLSKWLRVERATFEVGGDYIVHGSRAILDRGTATEGPVEVRWDGGLRVGASTFAENVVRIVPARDGDLKIGGARYHGELLVIRDEAKDDRGPRVTLVNEVDLETYVKGVVGKEMSLRKGIEALKAQVVAARTYAMFEVRARTLRVARNEKFDLYDDERSQVYGGMAAETSYASSLADSTRGQFVTWQERIIKTFFSSTCGGHTEPANLVLGGDVEDIPPLNGTICGDKANPGCRESRYFRWTATLDKAEIARKLFPDKPGLRVTKVEITKTLPGGHAGQVAISLEDTTRKVLLPANEGFRRKIDPSTIRSTFWERIDDDGKNLVISGRGWGHAVGMCQTGAYSMADRGFSGIEILETYYPGAKVRKLY